MANHYYHQVVLEKYSNNLSFQCFLDLVACLAIIITEDYYLLVFVESL